MSDLAQTFPEYRVQHGGKEIIVTPPTEGTRRDYTCLLEQLAVEFVIRNRKGYGTEYREARADVAKDGAAGKFEWNQQTWADSLAVPERCFELCFMVVKQKHPEMKREEFTDLYFAPDKLLEDPTQDVVKGTNIINKILEYNSRPNSRRPDAVPGAA